MEGGSEPLLTNEIAILDFLAEAKALARAALGEICDLLDGHIVQGLGRGQGDTYVQQMFGHLGWGGGFEQQRLAERGVVAGIETIAAGACGGPTILSVEPRIHSDTELH